MADERWTAETERLVEAGIHRGSRQCVLDLDECLTEHPHRREAREVLTALADAGRLLPEGGQTREEWRVTGDPGHGYPPYSFTWPRPGRTEDAEAEARAFVRPIRGRMDWADGPHLHRRTIVESPWRPVESEASAAGGETP